MRDDRHGLSDVVDTDVTETMTRKRLEKTDLEKRLEAELAVETSPEEGEEVSEAVAEAQKSDAETVAALTAERDRLKDQLLRLRAEFDNYRKRMVRDAERQRKTAGEALLRDLLPVLDHLELALQHANDSDGPLAQGVSLVLDQFNEVLRRNGVASIPAVGQPFDPNVHEAVMQMESDEAPPDRVTQEFQKGYTLGDYVLRPSKVVVSAGPSEDKGRCVADGKAGKAEEECPNDQK